MSSLITGNMCDVGRTLKGIKGEVEGISMNHVNQGHKIAIMFNRYSVKWNEGLQNRTVNVLVSALHFIVVYCHVGVVTR